MKKLRYNGWANYETWNLVLWLGNDECLYRAVRAAAADHKGKWLARDAQELIMELLPEGTPDVPAHKLYPHVRWGEVAGYLGEE